MTPREAWLYAAQWGSYIHGGDPGRCMYGFDERCLPQTEEHREACIRWINERCLPGSRRRASRRLRELRAYLISAPLLTGEKKISELS